MGDKLSPYLIALALCLFAGWPNLIVRPSARKLGNPIPQDVHHVFPSPAGTMLHAQDSNIVPLNLKNSLVTIEWHGSPSL
ncbi:hypothetical protein MAFF301524_23060 [Ralstonia pseudosolanacearum]|uniref:hypothetical protein n=1 Tax=Ralstonia pseudosolanacearum TaxID=1310165 RepID=UPI002B28E0D8|nr:hypothetical protein MAFF301524_23060 [Ralstonia pseudosolanacearum]